MLAASAIDAVCCGGVTADVVLARNLAIIRSVLQLRARVEESGLQAAWAYLYRVGGEEGRWWCSVVGHAAMFLWVRELAARAVSLGLGSGLSSFTGNSRQEGLSKATMVNDGAFVSPVLLELLSLLRFLYIRSSWTLGIIFTDQTPLHAMPRTPRCRSPPVTTSQRKQIASQHSTPAPILPWCEPHLDRLGGTARSAWA